MRPLDDLVADLRKRHDLAREIAVFGLGIWGEAADAIEKLQAELQQTENELMEAHAELARMLL